MSARHHRGILSQSGWYSEASTCSLRFHHTRRSNRNKKGLELGKRQFSKCEAFKLDHFQLTESPIINHFLLLQIQESPYGRHNTLWCNYKIICGILSHLWWLQDSFPLSKCSNIMSFASEKRWEILKAKLVEQAENGPLWMLHFWKVPFPRLQPLLIPSSLVSNTKWFIIGGLVQSGASGLGLGWVDLDLGCSTILLGQ